MSHVCAPLLTRSIRTNRAHNPWTYFIPQRIHPRNRNALAAASNDLSDRSIADLPRATIGCAHVRERSRKSHPRRSGRKRRGAFERSAGSRSRRWARARAEYDKPSAHTAQVRAVFEQLRAGRKAAFLSPLHRASVRRREREMAKPW